MADTKKASAPRQNHTNPQSVEIDQLDDEALSLFLGARKSTREVKVPGVSQLRRDTRRHRCRPFATILRIAFADVDEGENPDDLVAALYAVIGMIYTRAGRQPRADLGECIQAETDIEGKKRSLEVALLRGDRSTPVVAGLERSISDAIRTLGEEESAIRSIRYSTRRWMVAS